jgi:ankyrin repeat protein
MKAAENLFFYAAANSKVTDVIKLIQQKEVSVNCQNMNGTTALHVACVNQLSNIVKVLLHFLANPNLQELDFVGKRAPLHFAVENDNYEVCKLLLDFGANPNIKDAHNQTPYDFVTQPPLGSKGRLCRLGRAAAYPRSRCPGARHSRQLGGLLC